MNGKTHIAPLSAPLTVVQRELGRLVDKPIFLGFSGLLEGKPICAAAGEAVSRREASQGLIMGKVCCELLARLARLRGTTKILSALGFPAWTGNLVCANKGQLRQFTRSRLGRPWQHMWFLVHFSSALFS